MGPAKHKTPISQPVSASTRRQFATATTQAGVKDSSSVLYQRKWEQFIKFCTDEKIQEGNGVVDPCGDGEPSSDIIGKIVEFFRFKVVENGCDAGEVVNIRTALASIYKRQFGRVGVWKVMDDGSTEGSPTNSILVDEALLYYKREKKKVGFKRALPFRYKYMIQLWQYAKGIGFGSLYSCYMMGATSMCFTLWLRVDELINLSLDDVKMNESNEDGVPFHLVKMKDRKYMRQSEGQTYAVYKQTDEPSSCAFTHLSAWIIRYRDLLGRDFLPSDPLFPKDDEFVTKIRFGERIVQSTFMKTVNDMTRKSGIIPKNAMGTDMGRFTAHCFRRGGAQHRFITGKARWPLDVVKCWGVWGVGDDVNTIIRYLLEETSKYEKSFTHYLYTGGSDSRMFNSTASTIDELSREIQAVQNIVSTRFAQMEQSAAANRLFVSEQLKQFTVSIGNQVTKLEALIRRRSLDLPTSLPTLPPAVFSPGEIVAQSAGQEQDTATTEVAHDANYNHIPTVSNWRDVIQHWLHGCPEKNLPIALKDWPKGTRSDGLKYKYHDRKLIAIEYLNLGANLFITKYNPDSTLKELKKLIRDKNNK